MKDARLVLSAALLLLFARSTTADAQIETLSRLSVAPDSTIIKLTKRIEVLESMVAELQQKTAFIKSVSPLALDAGGDMTIRGGQISFDATGSFGVRAGNNLDLNSGSGFSLRAGANASIRSNSATVIDAGAILDLKGSSIRHNGGTVPIACAASALNLQTGAGGALRGEHTHAVSVPITPCSATVGVPGPGQ